MAGTEPALGDGDDDVMQRFRLDGTGRLLELAFGTGLVTTPLAGYVAEAVGPDPEGDMLIEATRHAQAAEVTNITWFERPWTAEQIIGYLYDLGGDPAAARRTAEPGDEVELSRAYCRAINAAVHARSR